MHSRLLPCIAPALTLLTAAATAAPAPKFDFGTVREEHIMIPMRESKRLSAYVFFPKGEGKWPAIFEQRYADISSVGS